MQSLRKVQLPWSEIDTVLLDMDGTLLDLAFDNYFWLEVVPERYAERYGVAPATAREELERRYAEVMGTLPWYCIDHWTAELGLDIRALKRAHKHMIRFLPRAREFLATARRTNKRLILVTNAHPETLAIKAEVTNVDSWMDLIVSSHEYRVPKEEPRFWHELIERHDVDKDTTVLFEDSVAVLNAASRVGIQHTIAIRRPDSRHGPRDVDEFSSIHGLEELLPQMLP